VTLRYGSLECPRRQKVRCAVSTDLPAGPAAASWRAGERQCRARWSVTTSNDSSELTAVVTGVAAAGLTAELRQTEAGLEAAATVRWPGRRETDVIVDEDGYAELHWWTSPATPAQAAASIARAVAAAPPGRAPGGARP